MTNVSPGKSGRAADGSRLKDQGNSLFKKGDYVAALAKYSQGTHEHHEGYYTNE
jgi:hypothetical protein